MNPIAYYRSLGVAGITFNVATLLAGLYAFAAVIFGWRLSLAVGLLALTAGLLVGYEIGRRNGPTPRGRS